MIERLLRAYRPVLKIYPRAFRRRFEEEMVEELRQTLRESEGRRLRIWLHAVWDTLRAAPSEWRGASVPLAAQKTRGGGLASVGRDLRFAVGGLRKAPGFSLVALLTLALGIGANTAIFSLVNAVILRPLPYPDPDRLVAIWPDEAVSQGELEDFCKGLSDLVEVSGVGDRHFTLTGEGDPEELIVNVVPAHYFDVLGAQPALGRTFNAQDQAPGAAPPAILRYGLWQRRFGGDPGILGRVIQLDGLGGASRQVIGVMPPGFFPLRRRAQAWTIQNLDPSDERYRSHGFIDVIGRLRPGVTIEQATEGLKALMVRLRDEGITRYSREDIGTARVMPLHEYQVGPVRPALNALQVAVGVVLLIVCVNMAGLILARGTSRQAELSLRAALGAGKGRLVRQLMTENALLGLTGGLAGIGLAYSITGMLTAQIPMQLPGAERLSVDVPVLLFSLGISLLSVFLFGLLPALRTVGRSGPAEVLAGNRGSGISRRGQRLHQGLVAAELALCLVVVVGAGLLVKSAWRLQQVDPGFSSTHVAALRLAPPQSRFAETEGLAQFYRRVREEAARVPGVETVGMIHRLPLVKGNTGTSYTVDGVRPSVAEGIFVANYRLISPGYFATLGIPIVAGRDFGSQDQSESAPVVIVNQAFVRKHWPGQDGVGREVTDDDGQPWLRVVGVVGDVRQHLLSMQTRPEMYVPIEQARGRECYLLARVRGDAAQALPSLRAAVWSVDDSVPIPDMRTMDEVVGASLAASRFYAWLFSAFAGLALLLGAVGVYGVMGYTMGRRTREIGIRKALGAQSRQLVRQALLRHAKPLAIGIAVGLLGATAGSRFLSSLLFEVTTTDPLVYLQVALFLTLVSLLAGYLPVRRAASVDPLQAIRTE